MKVDKPPVRWLKSYWDEEDILYFFEIDEDTWTLRQIELQGPTQTPMAAAALAEWPDPTANGLDAMVFPVERLTLPGTGNPRRLAALTETASWLGFASTKVANG